MTKQIKGKGDIVRAVKIQVMSQGKPFEIERPLQGICALEIDAPVREEKNEPKENKDKLTVKSDRPKRIATFVGEELRKLKTDVLNQEDRVLIMFARRAEECPKSRQINCADISITECLHKFKTTKCIKLQL